MLVARVAGGLTLICVPLDPVDPFSVMSRGPARRTSSTAAVKRGQPVTVFLGATAMPISIFAAAIT